MKTILLAFVCAVVLDYVAYLHADYVCRHQSAIYLIPAVGGFIAYADCRTWPPFYE